MNNMIQVMTTTGWCDYCEMGLTTDIVDVDNNNLVTGDVVEVLNKNYYEAGIGGARVDVAMIVADVNMRFISIDCPFVEGWLKADWNDPDSDWLIRRISRDDHDGARYRIIGDE